MHESAACARFTAGLWPRTLAAECATKGEKWDNLNKYIQYAVAKANVQGKPQKVSFAAMNGQGSFKHDKK